MGNQIVRLIELIGRKPILILVTLGRTAFDILMFVIKFIFLPTVFAYNWFSFSNIDWWLYHPMFSRLLFSWGLGFFTMCVLWLIFIPIRVRFNKWYSDFDTKYPPRKKGVPDEEGNNENNK